MHSIISPSLLSIAALNLFACGGSGVRSAPEELFIGHSFFKPFANNMESLQSSVGLDARSSEVVFSGGASGAPQALWEDSKHRKDIQGYLDGGNVELFVMTYEGTYPTEDGYVLWIDYALANNPDTTFALALPWPDYPDEYASAEAYSSAWLAFHNEGWAELLESLRAQYPSNDFVSIPYGQSALELRSRFEQGELPDVDALISNVEDSSNANDVGVFVDKKGHADEILIDLGTMVWGKVLYDIDPAPSMVPSAYQTDLAQIAADIVEQRTD